MKSKKVLIGLILAAFAGTAGISVAQTKANYQNKLYEIGPDNVGGRVRAVVVDQTDTTHQTLYAGGVVGGLYKWAPDATTWAYVPYYTKADSSAQLTLNISYLHQANDGMIYIGTGEGMQAESDDLALIIPKGTGVYQFDPQSSEFSKLPGSATEEYINVVKSLCRDNVTYLYVGTNDGLLRWTKAANGQWGNPETVFTEGAVQDIAVVSGDNMAFFTSGGRLFKVSNATATTATYTDITTTCGDFGGDNIRISLAAAKCEKTYLYAMVTNKNGGLKGVYLTTNQNRWTRLTTSTINPFSTSVDGWHASSITIDPTNAKRIIIAGATVWVGQGYLEDAYYQWSQVSYNEEMLNGGNFMEGVLPHPAYVHSGIHQITPGRKISNGDTTWNFYLATDGGVFKTMNNFGSFNHHNKGFNTVQYTSLAIAPDGSVLAGAVDNACTFIQSRCAHDSAAANDLWYDQGTSMNHFGNTIWFGDGGQVEASAFQQITPLSRRGLIMSNREALLTGYSMGEPTTIANVGRAYADYFDYTNTQTWTIHEDFLYRQISKPSLRAEMCLFETTNNQANDSVTFTIDTLGNFYHNGELTSFQDYEALGCYASDYTFKSGDRLIVPSRLHFNYPFEWTVDAGTIGTKVRDNMTLTVHNPIASRFYLSALTSRNQGTVFMTRMPNDYSRVGQAGIETDGRRVGMEWFQLYLTTSSQRYKAETVGCLASSTDGDALFVCCTDTNNERSYIVRIANLNAATANDYDQANLQLHYSNKDTRITVYDTLYFSATDYRFDRTISAISVVNRNGHDNLLIAFSGETGDYNVALIEDVNNVEGRTGRVSFKKVANGVPAYSCLIENTKGHYFLGTAQGVYTATSFNGTWSEYGDFNGVPVTAIRQQTMALPRAYYLGHTGINEEHYLFAKTKYPGAVYFGTYGRGVFMDMTYVTDTVNEISDPEDYLGIQTVDNSLNRIAVYPNPTSDYATIDMAVADGGQAVIRVYDITGKTVFTENLGRLNEGAHTYRLNCQGFRHGMYLVNVNIGAKSATSKLVVK